jgi:hypothetical protein
MRSEPDKRPVKDESAFGGLCSGQGDGKSGETMLSWTAACARPARRLCDISRRAIPMSRTFGNDGIELELNAIPNVDESCAK